VIADAILARCGMPPRVMRSTLDGITPEIRALIPDDLSRGFGLSGPVGSGKTGAVAAILIAAMESGVADGMLRFGLRSLPGGGYAEPVYPLAWASWPETVNALRIMSARDSGIDSAAELVERLAAARWLVLDDLGAERIRGDSASDWATSQLDLILDRRYTEMRPVWYTTSLSLPAFTRWYGRRMIERLVAENPLIVVPRLDSRRLVG